MLTLVGAAVPSQAERRMFEVFAVEANSLGVTLLRSNRLATPDGSWLDLTDAEQVEFALLSIRTAAKHHARRGEDLLTLVSRVMDMIDASTRREATALKVDVGLHALRAIAMAELLHQEAVTRFGKHVRLREMAQAALACLARGFVLRFGSSLPPEVAQVFPRFAQAVKSVQLDTLTLKESTATSLTGKALAKVFPSRSPRQAIH
jgi:hypothetical protein